MKTLNQKMSDTISGGITLALISLTFSTTFNQNPAQAAGKKNNDNAVTISQETINKKVYQVDKMRVDAPPESVWAILTNYEDSPKVYSKVTDCHVIGDDGAKKLVAFKVKAFKDMLTLDYTLNVTEHFPNSIGWTRNAGAFKANEGYWRIDPLEGGKACMLTYSKFVDGGAIPQFFVNKELKADMPLIIASVKVCAEANYQKSLQANAGKHESELRTRAGSISRAPGNETERVYETLSLKGPAHRGL